MSLTCVYTVITALASRLHGATPVVAVLKYSVRSLSLLSLISSFQGLEPGLLFPSDLLSIGLGCFRLSALKYLFQGICVADLEFHLLYSFWSLLRCHLCSKAILDFT